MLTKTILKDPLVHFLGLGLSLLLLFRLIGEPGETAHTVDIDSGSLLTFLQYQSAAFDAPQFEALLANMSERELEQLIDRVAREEILYREALALELERDDYIIRSRLVQKLEFLAEGFEDVAVELGAEEIEAYFEANRSEFDTESQITFTHVFFNAAQRGREPALALAEAKLQELNENAVPYSGAFSHGDRFPYFVNYVRRPRRIVAAHLGDAAAEALFQLDADDSHWRGAFESRYGFHLVLITEKIPRRSPSLEEIRERVADDARAARVKARTEAAIEEILAKYEVRVSPDLTVGVRTRPDDSPNNSEATPEATAELAPPPP